MAKYKDLGNKNWRNQSEKNGLRHGTDAKSC